MGDSGTGKTGALVSLVKDGFKLRILDYDNGLDSLVQQMKRVCPEKLTAGPITADTPVVYETLQDKFKATDAGPVLDGMPVAYPKGIKLLDRWKVAARGKEGEPDYEPGYDLGEPKSWGPDTILVVDSFTFFSNAALEWATVVKFSKDGRAIYGEAQDAIEHTLGMFKSDEFRCNVIVIAHVRYVDRDDGLRKGYPKSAGTALGPIIPAYFNTVLLMETSGSGENVKRNIRTGPTGLIDLKNPAAVLETFPISTGLADIFRRLRA